MSLRRLKASFAIGAGIGAFLVALGICSIVYFFTVKQVMGHSASIYGNYFVAGLVCIAFGAAVLRITFPAFIPIEQQTSTAIRICPYCGAIVSEEASFCQKCNRQLD
jgi:ribosomal protein L40E